MDMFKTKLRPTEDCEPETKETTSKAMIIMAQEVRKDVTHKEEITRQCGKGAMGQLGC
jgi:hypothetical protein